MLGLLNKMGILVLFGSGDQFEAQWRVNDLFKDFKKIESFCFYEFDSFKVTPQNLKTK